MCQFWLSNYWFDLSSLQIDNGFYRGEERNSIQNGIDFNFCMSMQLAFDASCKGNYYAGMWQSDSSGNINCVEPLSGPTTIPSESISVESIGDRDGNLIGLTLRYVGAPSGSYLKINVYCDRSQSTYLWD